MFFKLSDHIRALSWSPDGRYTAASLGNGEICLLDHTRERIAVQWAAHSAGVFQAEFCPNRESPILATSGEDGTVRMWHSDTGAQLGEYPTGTSWVEHLDWSGCGTFLAAAGEKTLFRFNCSLDLIGEHQEFAGTISALAWRPQGETVAVSRYGQVDVLPVNSADPWRALPFRSSFISLAWSPDGRHLAAGTQENMVLYWTYPFAPETPLNMSGYPRKVRQLAWDAKSRLLATGGGSEITVWNVSGRGPAGTRPAQLPGHESRVTALAFQNIGPYLASGDSNGSLRLWEPGKRRQGVELAALPAGITDLKWSPQDNILAAGAADGTFLWISPPI